MAVSITEETAAAVSTTEAVSTMVETTVADSTTEETTEEASTMAEELQVRIYIQNHTPIPLKKTSFSVSSDLPDCVRSLAGSLLLHTLHLQGQEVQRLHHG